MTMPTDPAREMAEAVANRCVRDCGDATLQMRGMSWEEIITEHVAQALAELQGERDAAMRLLYSLGGEGSTLDEAIRNHDLAIDGETQRNLETALARQGEVLGRVPHLEKWRLLPALVASVEGHALEARDEWEADCIRLGGQCAIRDALGEGKESNKNGT